MGNRRLFLVFLILSSFQLFFAQETRIFDRQEVLFDSVDKDLGLPSNQVYTLIQDRRGLLWIGSSNGLSRYDSQEIHTYSHDPQQGNSLSNNAVRSVIEDRSQDGLLWIGTQFGGLNRFDFRKNEFSSYRYDADDPTGLGDDNVLLLVQDGEGRIWIATENGGLDCFDPEKEVFEDYSHNPEDPSSMGRGIIRCFLLDSRGDLWFGNSVLNRFDRESGTFVRYPISRSDVSALLEDSKGRFWISTANHGLFSYDRETDSVNPVSTKYNQLNGMAEDGSGNLWIGTARNGIFRFTPESGRTVSYTSDPGNPRSLASNRVNGIYRGMENMLWIIFNKEGVDKLNLSQFQFGHIKFPSDNERSNSFSRVFMDSKGRLWFGGPEAILHRYDRETGEHRKYNLNYENNSMIDIIYEDSGGTLWFGGWRLGLNWYDEENDAIRRYTANPSDPNSLSVNHVYSIREDHLGFLWVGVAYGDLNRLDRSTDTFKHYKFDPSDPHSISDVEIITIYEDSRNRLWLGSFSNGLNLYDREGDRFIRFTNNPDDYSTISGGSVNNVMEDSGGRIWISTAGGLDLYEESSGTFRHYTMKNGLPDNHIRKVVEDLEGFLWIAVKEKGLSRFDPEGESFINYNSSNGLSQSTYSDIFYTSENEIIICGTNGINYFFPLDLKKNNLPPRPFISDFLLFNSSVKPGEKNSPLTLPIYESDYLDLTYRDSVFSFLISSLSFQSPGDNRFAYKMEGFDKNWNYVDPSRRLITYTSLDPGRYTFRVRASNNDGLWGPEHSIALSVTPPLWQRWWAFLFYILALVSLVLLIIQLRTRSHVQEINRIIRLNKIKDEFLARTSHELRTPLHGIIGIAETLIEGSKGTIDSRVKEDLKVIVHSGKRLTNLINDVLDFSRLKNEDINLQLRPVDLYALSEITLPLIQSLIGAKDLVIEQNIQ